ncbi:MAG TPA: FHA domain-containing protein [Chloroflexi bacterium]|nr:FHA domain-containing protein [Chloroflexota bacterium]
MSSDDRKTDRLDRQEIEKSRKAQGRKSAVEEEEERLIKAARAHKAQESTAKLNQKNDLLIAQGLAFGRKIGGATQYIRLPARLAGRELPDNVPVWRIELHELKPVTEPLGLEIVGDVVIGRRTGGTEFPPDLDLSPYDAARHGVSRRHALLRPTRNNLYLIDLDSTNGTARNAITLGPGVAQALKHNDTIALGSLTFTVKIIEKPSASHRQTRLTPQQRIRPEERTASGDGRAASASSNSKEKPLSGRE